ncbi:CheY-like chemotaxis protein [Gillisia mitskevichiae]|uniref:CheY-like chemotaxis protein n=1 Tax=Gillisia mitskevichiae TaxID=270921 RepID=A0A495PSP8_9FLAO|nr:response regulator [Gillisia mitskevichiae]RKS53551.1 CheY-like chemotaxis protein [Gillisia mitskevichiae]
MNSVILVDDQPITNFITRKLLQVEGINIPISDFTNPVLALEQILKQKEQNDVIFLDLNMPEMSGWDFLDKLVENNYTPKIVILTSSTSNLDKEKASEYDFVTDYIIKPLSQNKISELCSKHCK